MPFLDIRNDMLPPGLPGSGGPTSGMGENFDAGYQDQSRNNALFGMEAQIEEDYVANQALVHRLTGEAPRNYPLAVYTFAARAAEGADPAGFWQRSPGGQGFGDPDQQRMWDDFSANERRLAELKLQNPDVKTFADIWAGVRAKAQDIERNTADVEHRAGVMGTLGGFAGRVAGSFTWRDPVNLGTLGLGGVGRSVATRILTEAGANAGIEAVDQFYGVQEGRRMLGLTEQSPWESIMFAGAGAGVLRGGFEGAGPGFRALEAKVNPNRAAARIISGEIERNLGKPMGSLMVKSGLSDEQILDFLRARPQSADVRGAAHALEEEADTLRANPFGDGREADVLHGQRLQEAYGMIDGRMDRGEMIGSTAMARVLDAPGAPRVVLPDGPVHDLHHMEIERLARDTAPDVFRRLDEANAKLAEATAVVDQMESGLSGRGVSDAIGLTDTATAERIRAIETEMEGPVPAARRQDLEREMDMLVQNFPAEAVAQRERDFRIGAERRLRDTEAGRRAAKKELRRATKEAEAVVQRVVNQQQAVRAVAGAASRKQEAALARDAMSVGLRPIDPAERYGTVPVKEQIDRLVQVIDEAAQRQDERGKAMVERARTPAEAAGDGPQKVDIGLDDLVPEDFAVPIGAMDVGGRREVQSLTVRQILDDLAEDEKMVQQMKVCSL